MARASNGVLAFINIVILTISLAAIGASVYFHVHRGSTDCQKLLEQPLLALGVSLLVVSLLGVLGSCCRANMLLVIYLILLYVLVIGLIGFMTFAVLVTNKGVKNAVSDAGFKEYRLGDYSNWLQNLVINGKHWGKIKSCLIDSNVCSSLGGGKNSNANQTLMEFYQRVLSPTQSGCCKPPTYCGLDFKNATFWTIPEGGPVVPDSDCTTWSNNQATGLCYDCKSCKAGILANIKKKWSLLTFIFVGILMFITIVYSIGCCVYKNN